MTSPISSSLVLAEVVTTTVVSTTTTHRLPSDHRLLTFSHSMSKQRNFYSIFLQPLEQFNFDNFNSTISIIFLQPLKTFFHFNSTYFLIFLIQIDHCAHPSGVAGTNAGVHHAVKAHTLDHRVEAHTLDHRVEAHTLSSSSAPVKQFQIEM